MWDAIGEPPKRWKRIFKVSQHQQQSSNQTRAAAAAAATAAAAAAAAALSAAASAASAPAAAAARSCCIHGGASLVSGGFKGCETIAETTMHSFHRSLKNRSTHYFYQQQQDIITGSKHLQQHQHHHQHHQHQQHQPHQQQHHQHQHHQHHQQQHHQQHLNGRLIFFVCMCVSLCCFFFLKGLTMLEYMLKNGVEKFAEEARDKSYLLRMLQNFNWAEEGRDKGAGSQPQHKEQQQQRQQQQERAAGNSSSSSNSSSSRSHH
ncbi:hypothetical protein ACSSS7_002997 [Eimeria intestinalis]